MNNGSDNPTPYGWADDPEAAADAGPGWQAETSGSTKRLTNTGLYNDGNSPTPEPPPEQP